ncbi:MAG: hypothetical protein JXA71_03980, partial [Chitinispirillaceae bacterium]|nr:hypothetical protein [Chitinispirillaceae bacterium]
MKISIFNSKILILSFFLFSTNASPASLLAHWSFDSSSGNTYYDVTGHGYDAVATGTGVGLAPG